jgi:hypothetical protein
MKRLRGVFAAIAVQSGVGARPGCKKHQQIQCIAMAAGRLASPLRWLVCAAVVACSGCRDAIHLSRSKTMRTRHSIIAVAVLLALGASGHVSAQDQTEAGAGDNNSTRGSNRDNTTQALASGLGSAAADNNSTATATLSNSFNNSSAVARTELNAVVTGNAVYGLGNIASNTGNAGGGRGGSGGDGGHGIGGLAVAGSAAGGGGGDGGDGVAGSARDGDSGSGSWTGAEGWSGASAPADARTRSRERGAGDATVDSNATGTATATGDVASTGGAASSTNDGSSGDASAMAGAGGMGGSGTGGDAAGGAGAGGAAGNGGTGGNGGTAYADAGDFNMSNAMNGTANAAAGIMVVAQNSGAASLIQQGVTVQANLNVGQ